MASQPRPNHCQSLFSWFLLLSCPKHLCRFDGLGVFIWSGPWTVVSFPPCPARASCPTWSPVSWCCEGTPSCTFSLPITFIDLQAKHRNHDVAKLFQSCLVALLSQLASQWLSAASSWGWWKARCPGQLTPVELNASGLCCCFLPCVVWNKGFWPNFNHRLCFHLDNAYSRQIF